VTSDLAYLKLARVIEAEQVEDKLVVLISDRIVLKPCQRKRPQRWTELRPFGVLYRGGDGTDA
jgi:hypothetical protein